MRISASSYSNTAPLIWSFLYGSQCGKAEILLDFAPARSLDLLANRKIDVALTPVIGYQFANDFKLVKNVCVGAENRVQSVCLVTRGLPLEQVKSVSLDVSSKTSVCLTKIIFREFLGFEPEWRESKPVVHKMLAESDCAMLIGDPALELSFGSEFLTFDLVELWRSFTNLGFVFAMWMTRHDKLPLDFSAARDEGLTHIDDIAANYEGRVGLTKEQISDYLRHNISYDVSDSMRTGLELFFELGKKCGLIEQNRGLDYCSCGLDYCSY